MLCCMMLMLSEGVSEMKNTRATMNQGVLGSTSKRFGYSPPKSG